MDIVATWHPQSQASGSTVNMTKTTGKFVFINESSVNMIVSLSNGFNFYLGSSDRRMICLTTTSPTFTWVSVGATSPPGFDNAFVEHYQPGEQLLESYPSPLMRQVNVGNSVNTVAGTAQYLQDDADAAAHQFIESTVTGSASSAILILNDGTVTIKGDVAHVLTTLLQLLPSAASGASSVILGDSTRRVETLGDVQVDGIIQAKAAQDLKVNVPTGQAIRFFENNVDLVDLLLGAFSMQLNNPAYINTGAGTDLVFNVQTGQRISFRVNNVEIAGADATGLNIPSGAAQAINFQSGRIFRHRTGHVTGTAVTVTHGLGATPQTVIVSDDIAQPGSSTCGAGSVGATTFAGDCPATGNTGWWWQVETG